jgi:hypothetical protein
MLIIIDLPLFIDPCVLLISTGVAETAVGLFLFFIYFTSDILRCTYNLPDNHGN